MSHYTIPLFFSMFVLAIVWLGLVQLLFRSLAKNHPAMYERIGSPRGFEPRATSALISFLFTRKPESLEDRSLLVHVNVMRVLLGVYVTGFFSLVYVIVSAHNAS